MYEYMLEKRSKAAGETIVFGQHIKHTIKLDAK